MSDHPEKLEVYFLIVFSIMLAIAVCLAKVYGDWRRERKLLIQIIEAQNAYGTWCKEAQPLVQRAQYEEIF